MIASTRNAAHKGFRAWWLSPPRTGLQLLINPIEYRHLRFFGGMRIAGGSAVTGIALICLASSAFDWAAFFMAVAVLNFLGGTWFLRIANSKVARS